MPSINSVNLLDISKGIQEVLDMPAAKGLPRARDIATGSVTEAGLNELYAPRNAATAIEALLVPEVGDGTMLNPETFARELESAARTLNESDDPDVRKLVDEELAPLLQNGQLLDAYKNLMVQG